MLWTKRLDETWDSGKLKGYRSFTWHSEIDSQRIRNITDRHVPQWRRSRVAAGNDRRVANPKHVFPTKWRVQKGKTVKPLSPSQLGLDAASEQRKKCRFCGLKRKVHCDSPQYRLIHRLNEDTNVLSILHLTTKLGYSFISYYKMFFFFFSNILSIVHVVWRC